MIQFFLRCVCFIFICVSLTPIHSAESEKTPKETIQKNYIVFNHGNGGGFFALFSTILGTLNIYDIYQNYYSGIHIDLVGGAYCDPEHGPNWWEYYFEPICIGERAEPVLFYTPDEVLQLCSHGFSLSRERAHELIQKYVHVRPEIQREIDDYIHEHFNGYLMIGIHYRGTDKKLEIPLVPYENVFKQLNDIVAPWPTEIKSRIKLYIATDDQLFLDYILPLSPFPIVYNQFVRSDNGKPLHYGSDSRYGNNYQKGKEVLMDCLLLSRCHILIRPPFSSVSLMSQNFNPNMPVYVQQ